MKGYQVLAAQYYAVVGLLAVALNTPEPDIFPSHTSMSHIIWHLDDFKVPERNKFGLGRLSEKWCFGRNQRFKILRLFTIGHQVQDCNKLMQTLWLRCHEVIGLQIHEDPKVKRLG